MKRETLFTISGLSDILDYDRRTLTRKLQELKPDKTEKSRELYRISTVVQELIRVETKTATDKYDEARIRLTNAQADKTELEVEELRGNYISLENMKAMWGNVLGAFRARVLSIPSRLTPQVAALRDPKKIEKLIKDMLHEALNELSTYDPASNPRTKGSRKGIHKNSGGTTAS